VFVIDRDILLTPQGKVIKICSISKEKATTKPLSVEIFDELRVFPLDSYQDG